MDQLRGRSITYRIAVDLIRAVKSLPNWPPWHPNPESTSPDTIVFLRRTATEASPISTTGLRDKCLPEHTFRVLNGRMRPIQRIVKRQHTRSRINLVYEIFALPRSTRDVIGDDIYAREPSAKRPCRPYRYLDILRMNTICDISDSTTQRTITG